MKRKEFLKYLGIGTAVASVAPHILLSKDDIPVIDMELTEKTVKPAFKYSLFSDISETNPSRTYSTALSKGPMPIMGTMSIRKAGTTEWIPYPDDIDAEKELTMMLAKDMVKEIDQQINKIVSLKLPEKRVFKVDVGNMDDKDIEAHIKKLAIRFKKGGKLSPTIIKKLDLKLYDEDVYTPKKLDPRLEILYEQRNYYYKILNDYYK